MQCIGLVERVIAYLTDTAQRRIQQAQELKSAIR
jgi:gas vesicle GvpC-like protein